MRVMHNRIVGRQQATTVELGRLRMGTYEGRPKASKVWILTSPFRNYLDHAAALRKEDGTPVYGGTVEPWQPQGKGGSEWRLITDVSTIEVLLGPGDPVSQANELWSAGGCQRRCDGETAEIREQSGNGAPDRKVMRDCVCLATFGDEWHRQKDGTVCKTHTRINVMIEDLPGVGFWRIETKGFYASGRVTGLIDIAKAVVGPRVLLPARFTILERSKVEGGKTSRFTELVAQIPGFTFGQLRRGELGGLTELDALGSAKRQAIEASAPTAAAPRSLPAAPAAPVVAELTKPAPVSRPTSPARPPATSEDTQSFEKLIADAPDEVALKALWMQHDLPKHPQEVRNAWFARRTAIRNGDAEAAPATPAEAAEVEPDRDDLWAKALRLGGEKGWDTPGTSRRFRETVGKEPQAADGWTHEQFVEAIQSGKVV